MSKKFTHRCQHCSIVTRLQVYIICRFLPYFSCYRLQTLNRSSCRVRVRSYDAQRIIRFLSFCIKRPRGFIKCFPFIHDSYTNGTALDLLSLHRNSPGKSLPTASASFLRLSPCSRLGVSRHCDPYFASFSRRACNRLFFTIPYDCWRT